MIIHMESRSKIMWIVPSAIFWGSAATVVYTYAGYPTAIKLLSKFFPRPILKQDYTPKVSIVLAAHNERKVIASKLENLLQLDYPKDKKQIIVVSDGSTDDMELLVEPFTQRGVELFRLNKAEGKPTALNLGVSKATGDIIVFCDARQTIGTNALHALTACFADASVGAVSGELELTGKKGLGFYWKYEKFIRMAEAEFDSAPGATGALFAIRKNLFEPIPKDLLLDDVFTPMQIILKGFRVVFESNAKIYDKEASTNDEFQRKSRTLAGNFQLLHHLPGILNPFKNRIFGQFASHKLLRLVCPFALITLLGSNIILVVFMAPGWPIYVLTLVGQLIGYGLAINGYIAGEDAGKLSKLASTFTTLNGAAIVGLKRYLYNDFMWTSSKK